MTLVFWKGSVSKLNLVLFLSRTAQYTVATLLTARCPSCRPSCSATSRVFPDSSACLWYSFIKLFKTVKQEEHSRVLLTPGYPPSRWSHPSIFSSPPLTFSQPLLSAGIVASLKIYSLGFTNRALTKHVLHNWHISLAREANEGDDEDISLYWVSCGSLRRSHSCSRFISVHRVQTRFRLNKLMRPGLGKLRPVKAFQFRNYIQPFPESSHERPKLPGSSGWF